MTPPRLLILPGSLRTGSYNLALATHAARRAPELGFASARLFDLRALALPVYDGDLEKAEGVPAGALVLQQVLRDSEALLIVTPEYNAFPPPLLINSLDWLSRLPENVTALKPTALMSASPGAYGGLRSLNLLRLFVQGNFQMLAQPQQFALSRADQAFDADGGLKDERAQGSVDGVLKALAALAAKL
jgi:NAD(P)H-dependent FMN reductase